MKINIGFFLIVWICCTFFTPKFAKAQWIQTNGPVSPITCFGELGTILFAGTDGGGVFRSTNNGTSWTAVNGRIWSAGSLVIDATLRNLHVQALVASSAYNILFVGTNGGGIFRSLDSGYNWEAVDSGMTGKGVYTLTHIGTGLFAGTSGGIFRSNNMGISWTAVGSNLNDYNNITALGAIVAQGNGKKLFAATYDNVYGASIYLSTNFGNSCSSVAGSWTNNASISINTFVVNVPNQALVFAGTSGGVYRSIDSGYSWIAVNNGLTNFSVTALAMSGTNLFAGTFGGGVFRSTNSGTSWTAVNSGLPSNTYVKALAVNGTNLFAGTATSGVFRSTDDGANWTAVNSALADNYAWGLAEDGSNLISGNLTSGIFVSTDNGTNWVVYNGGSNGLLVQGVQILAMSGTNLFAGTYGGGVFLSTNDAASWTAVNTGLDQVPALAAGGGNLFAGTGSGVFRSTDNGSSWSQDGVTNGNILSLVVEGANVFAGSNSRILFHSTDNGSSWTQGTMSGGKGNIYSINALAVKGANLFAGTSSGVFLSTDNGTSWRAANFGMTNVDVRALITNGTKLFAGALDSGVFLSTNDGSSWTEVGLKGTSVRSFAVYGMNLFAGTDSSGVLRRPLSEMVGSIQPPGKIQLTAPSNGSMTSTPIIFSWVADPTASSYTWDFASDVGFTHIITSHSGIQPTTELPSYPNGTYYWRVHASNDGGVGLYSDTWQFTIKALGVGTFQNQEIVGNLYPNPTTGAFTITIPENLNHIQAFLYDERGAQILDATSSMTRSASDRVEFFLKNVPPGSYLLDLRSDKENLRYKLNLVK